MVYVSALFVFPGVTVGKPNSNGVMYGILYTVAASTVKSGAEIPVAAVPQVEAEPVARLIAISLRLAL
ncbi:hypothetical protein D3C86_1881640 [compost metagenome]